MIIAIAGDTGYIFNLYLVGEEEFVKSEWFWNLFYAISFCCTGRRPCMVQQNLIENKPKYSKRGRR